MERYVRIYNIVWKTLDADDVNWYCKKCGALLNEQEGFDVDVRTLECEECGHLNFINEDEIRDNQEIDSLPTEDEDYYDIDSYDYFDKVCDKLKEKYDHEVDDFEIEELDNDDHVDENGETIDVYDAAQIWLSHGKDEDYMFGYSEEELEDALS